MIGKAESMEVRQLDRVREKVRLEFSKVRQKLRTAIRDASDALEMVDAVELEALNACRREDMLPESSVALSIYRLTAAHLGMQPERISPGSRDPRQVAVRHLAMWLYCDAVPGTGLTRAGLAFERHHTTVLYAQRQVEKRIAAEPEYAAMVETLRAALRNGHKPDGMAAQGSLPLESVQREVVGHEQ